MDSVIFKDTFLATLSETEAIDDYYILKTTLGDTVGHVGVSDFGTYNKLRKYNY